MSVRYEEPRVTPVDSPVAETVETHPAYAQISASRVSGQTYLYGSDFTHQHYVTISIHRSELYRGLSNDWPHAREEYLEVALSEAQWATFVSTLNTGSGVQCTLNHRDRKSVPQIPAAPERKEQFQNETDGRLKSAMDSLTTLREQIENCSLSGKAKSALLGSLETTRREIGSNIKFVAEQFGEHMEKIVEHAKIEVNAYVQQTLIRAGQESLNGKLPIMMLTEGEDDKGVSNGSKEEAEKPGPDAG